TRRGGLRLFERLQSRAARCARPAGVAGAGLYVSAPALKRAVPAAPSFLPYGRQVIEDDDIAAVAEVLRGEYLTTGPTVARFEKTLATYVGAKHAVVCANGTAALHMAARALDLGQGTKIIVPAITFLAT